MAQDQGPLAGMRVLDLTGDSGRFATKLLAECGASLVRLGRGQPGPAMRSPDAAARGGLLDWWYDGGKARADVDLDTSEGVDAYRRLAERADLVIETEPPGRLAARGIDHPDLVASNPALVQVSLTPFGRTGPRASWRSSDLVAAALGGVLSVSGLPDEPVNPWGRQAFNFGSLIAAISGLAGVRSARLTGAGQHVDVSLHEVVCSSIEQLFFQYWFDDMQPYPKIAPRQGSLHWIGAYHVVPAQSGWLMITPTPNAAGLFGWMVQEGFSDVNDLLAVPLEELVGNVPRIMKTIRSFALTKDSTSLFWGAQERKVAFGDVQSVAQIAVNPQHEFRGFFRDVEWDGSSVRMPGPVARFHGTPAPAPTAPAASATPIDEILAGWEPRPAPAASRALVKPLEGVRVLDFTHVLAGPFGNRVLGDLGADVIKLQTAERATIVNSPDHPYFYTWNRSRRSVSLNMKDVRAVDVVRRLVEHSDVLIENFSAGVLDRWGLSYETVRSWNARIVYVTMSGCGHEGPWSRLVTYAPTIHALSGITYLSNPPGRGDVGPGYSLNDHAAGMSAAFSVLAALQARERTGEGQHVDIAQMETGAYLIGPAVLDYLTNGREAQPIGNADPFGLAVNDCYPTADGWLAVTCLDEKEAARLAEATGTTDVREWASTTKSDDAQELLQSAGIAAGKIQNAGELMADPQLVVRGMWRSFDHAVFGRRPYDRFPAIWSGTTLEPYQPPPSYVGEHNFEIYPEVAGIDEAAVGEGIADGLFT
jgi:crotonobetainyl-CoA:carnitine CoA-transferase CaiB-like acyl-CoA transferase